MFKPKHIARYFVRGCLALAPLALTAYIVYLILKFADRLLPVGIPGLGIVMAVVVITLVGFLTSNVIGRGILELADRLLTRVPLVKLIYASLKDLIGAFVGERRSFNQPVSLALTADRSVLTLGFITRDSLAMMDMPGHVAVYLPQSYNFAGNLLMVPARPGRDPAGLQHRADDLHRVGRRVRAGRGPLAAAPQRSRERQQNEAPAVYRA